MTVRSKTILILIASFVGLSIIFESVFDSIFLNRFRLLERGTLEKNLGRGIKGLESEIEKLTSQASDWSKWDDTYRFIENKNQAYIDSNIAYQSLIDTGVSELLFFDNKAKLVFGVNTEAVEKSLSAPLPALMEVLLDHREILYHQSDNSVKTGLLTIGTRTLIFASLPVLTSVATGPSKGTLFWGRYLNTELVNQIRAQVDLDLRLNPIFGASAERTPPTSEEVSLQTEILDEEKIKVSTLVKDYFGKPALKISIVAPREEFAQGLIMRRALFKALLITGAIFSLLIYALLEISVLSKMRLLTKELKGIVDITSIKKRVTAKGHDEFAEIGSNINRMLETLSEGAELLHQAKLQAETASRSKSDFLTNISHEVRTPLNGIMGMIRAVLVMERDPDKEQFLRTALDSSQTLLDIINDILDLSKVEAHKVVLENVSFNLYTATEEALRTVSLKGYEKDLDIALDIDFNIPSRMIGDSLRYKQIIMNLTGNAIKFTESGGIKISLQSELLEGNAIRLMCQIQDSGIGIPHAQKELIFSPFSQVDASTTRRFGGTGLGLSITKNLIELMGGTIWFESELGVGTTFHFTLLLNIDQNQPSLPIARGTLNNQRILITSGSPITRALIAKQLSNCGALVLEAETATTALSFLNQMSPSSDTPITGVIADQSLPLSDVETLLQHLTLGRDSSSLTLAAIIPCHKIALQESMRILGIKRILITPYLPLQLIRLFAPAGSIAEQKREEINESTERISSLKILVADDIHVNRLVLETLLRQAGHEVSTATDGRQVIKILEKEHWQPGNQRPFDIILMDLQMPDLDGFATTRVIKRRERKLREMGTPVRSVPVVAVSAHELNLQDAHLAEVGFEALCPKPIDPILLNKMLAQVTGCANTIAVENKPCSAAKERLTYLESLLRECAQAFSHSDWIPINLSEISERFSGEEDIVFEALRAYIDESDLLTNELKNALKAGDHESISARAHALKGSLANISATQAYEHARRLEKDAAQLSETELTSVGDALINETSNLKEIISAFLIEIENEISSQKSLTDTTLLVL
jgi:signal transduction histidine kinase/DNA-binding response OmpR family regulator/HPt (histidine-containing phosphotransfer) domain-containing protein